MIYHEFKTIESFKEENGYTIDDVWYPRVTKIVGIKAKPALYRYYGEAKSYKHAQSATERSAKEGTLVHEAAEAILLGQNPTVDISISPAIAAFQDFINRNHIQTMPEWVERRILSLNHRYAGTIDALAVIDGKFGVLDIKTSQDIYRDYNLQTSAYMEALKSEFENLQTRWILRIDQNQDCARCGGTLRTKGGREKIKRDRNTLCREGEHEWGEMKGIVELKEFPYWHADFNGFLGAKRLWEWENEFWLKRVGYA